MKQTNTTLKKIGSTKFYITPFGAFTAARVSGLLSSVVAPVIGKLSPLLEGTTANNAVDDLMGRDVSKILPVLAEALGQLSGDKFEELMKELLITHENVSYVTEDGDTERLSLDAANEIFCGELQDMILLCVEVARINYGSFFKSLADQSGNLQGITGKIVGTKNGESLT